MLPISSTAVRHTIATLALATAALGATTIPAHADEVGAPAYTSISVRALKPQVEPGRKDAVTGNLHVQGVADAAGRQVTLEARSQGAEEFVPVGVTTAGEAGGLRLQVLPEVTTRYRWSYAGAADAIAQTSGVVTVRVRDAQHRAHRLGTSLSVRALDRPGDDVVKGRLRSGRTELRGRLVVLLAGSPGQEDWRFVASSRTGRDGEVDFRVGPDAATGYRLQFLGTTAFRPARSGVVQVAPSPSVTIAASPRSIDAGATTTLSGVVSRAGTPVAGAVVDLLARATGSGRDLRVVATAPTGPDGLASLVVTPTRSTTYRLQVRATATTSQSLSAVTTVVVRATSSLSVRARTSATGTVVSGTLRSLGKPVVGQDVALLAQAPGATSFEQVATAVTGRRGGVQLAQPAAPGTAYRLDFAGSTTLAATTSGTVVS